jgi:hypothetical protein
MVANIPGKMNELKEMNNMHVPGAYHIWPREALSLDFLNVIPVFLSKNVIFQLNNLCGL